MRGPNLRPPWALLPLAFAVLAAQAAGSDAPQRCAEIGDDRARLACYDAIFRKPAASAASTAVPAAAADYGRHLRRSQPGNRLRSHRGCQTRS